MPLFFYSNFLSSPLFSSLIFSTHFYSPHLFLFLSISFLVPISSLPFFSPFSSFFSLSRFLSASEGKKTLGGDTKSSLFYILIRDYGALEATKSMTRLSKLCARFLGMSTKCEDEWVHCWKKGKKEEGKEGWKEGGRKKEGRKEEK